MKIEILYPEICTLYGDKGNTMYLQKCLPDAEFVTTGLNEKPLFLKENIADPGRNRYEEIQKCSLKYR